ncbi:hypothetical protein NP233_g2604 [Leucocoprinus birnbaumii]|uniref:Uncharacterized protein n=1 Tax=Leucocoprinus birnbaumii TaxID=56174 RepID=A0AAD5W139_9AGAR|nr:hypothetical protein NP233_g2604 [Leucocoprinus birnbaumii]
MKQSSRRKDSLGYAMPPLPHHYHHHHPLASSSSGAPTPQLSSGPSSSGSSPGSLGQPTPLGPPPLLPPGAGLVGGASATSSRAPSPISWTSSLAAGQMTATANVLHSGKREHSHSNLAHSVRMAFGMTPIVPSPPRTHAHAHSHSRTSESGLFASHPVSGVTTPMHSHSHSYSHSSLGSNLWGLRSMPGSRSGSPPITLPPLKVPKGADDEESDDARDEDEVGIRIKKEDVDDGDDVLMDGVESKKGGSKTKKRVELPGFSQFEAAARGLPLASTSTSASASQKMSIDFVR